MLERVNEHLCPDMPEKMFVTCLYGVLDPDERPLRFANAGHDLPYVKTADGVVELRARGMPLGLMPGMTYEEKEAMLAAGRQRAAALRRRRRGARPRARDVRLPAAEGDAGATAPAASELIDRVLAELAAFTGPGRRAGGRHHDGDAPAHGRRGTHGPAAPTARCSPSSSCRAQPGNEREAMERVERARRRRSASTPRASSG